MEKKSYVMHILKLFTIILFSVPSIVFASTPTKTLSVGDSLSIANYFSGLKVDVNTLDDGSICYSLDSKKKNTSNIDLSLLEKADKGLSYILQNGYPNKEITGEREKDIYITQFAIWWYLDDTTGSNNISNDIKVKIKDTNNIRSLAKRLVDSAKKVSNKKIYLDLDLPNNFLLIDSNGKFYESSEIDLEIKNASYYTVDLGNAPSGSFTTDSYGNHKTKFKINEKFRVYVPENKCGESASFTAKIIAVKENSNVYKYKAEDNNIQSVISSTLYSNNITKSINVDFEIFKSRIKVNVLDDKTNKKVSGFTLILKDASGNIVTSWVSTGSSHVIENLPQGKYYIQETIAPVKYNLNKSESSFKITDSKRSETINIKSSKNDNKRTIVKIITLDKNTNNPISNSVLVIKDKNKKEVLRFDSTNDYYTTNKLKKGTYTLEEIEAPSGYELSSKKQTFKVSDDNKEIILKVYNTAKNSLVSISNIDSNTNSLVSGSILVIKDSNGFEIARFTTTDKPYTIENIDNGNYTVEMISVADGYILNTDKVHFVIDDNNKSCQVTIKCDQQLKVNVPNTNSNNLIIFYVIGGIILCGTIGFVCYYEKK